MAGVIAVAAVMPVYVTLPKQSINRKSQHAHSYGYSVSHHGRPLHSRCHLVTADVNFE
jgi:hypothetical protein